MNGVAPVTLQISATGLDTLCRRLATHSPRPEQRLAALSALQTFIAAAADSGQQASAAYAALRTVLDGHAEAAREAVLADNARHLRTALERRDVAALARLYRALSRGGFWTVLECSISTLAEATALHAWCEDWVNAARARGEAASGFPDAMDFAGAGIDVVEYSAMSDLATFLRGHTP